MKKILSSILICGTFLFTTFSLHAEIDDSKFRIDRASSKFESLIAEKGETYKSVAISSIETYEQLYSSNTLALFLLSELKKKLAPGELAAPNILLIIADDMGLDASPGYDNGAENAPMPHLEAMIENGLVFENFWTAPTCTPTRGTILTGKYGIRTGVLAVDDPMPLNEKALQTYLPDEYSHAVIGKWHLSRDPDHPNDIGVDYYAGMLSGGVKSYWDWTLTENGTQTSQDEYITSKFTDLAIDWKNKQDSPWFLWLAYTSPHTPFHLPPNELHSSDSLDPSEGAIEENPLPYYHAMLESLDTEIGRFLDSMSEAEHDNTIIIFMGDNGTPAQVVQDSYERPKVKGSLYQGGINTPLIVSGAGISRLGQREDALINSVDIFSTVLNLANTGVSQMHDSKSFATLLQGENATTRDYIYGEVGGDGRQAGHTIRNTQYKYLVLDSGREFFYDLLDDPYEQDNIISRLDDDASLSLDSLKNTLEIIRGDQ